VREFVYSAHPARVVFGAGSLEHLPRELQRLNLTRALILCTPGQTGNAERVSRCLGDAAAGVFAKAAMHVPVEIAEEAGEQARHHRVDCTVAIGGGSTTGLAKAIALELALPIIAIPTTYAGSEVTPIYGLTAVGIKRTGKDPRVLPRAVIYDPQLTLDLPFALTVTSGMNAIAHAVEGLYANDGNPIMDLLAEEGIRAIATSLPALRENPADPEARSQALYGAWLCGTVLGNVGMALHHKLCHALGGAFNLPHAALHTIILPHAVDYNAPAASLAMIRISRVLGTQSAARGLYDLARVNGAPCALRDIGMTSGDLDRAADIAAAQPYWNPRSIDRDAIRKLLDRAHEGVRPD
jgi:maleylacetate reductase